MLKVVVYSTDSVAVNLIKSLLDSKSNIIIPELNQVEVGELIIIDHSYPHSFRILDELKRLKSNSILAVISFNPYALSQFVLYNIHATLSKPLSVEGVQALFIGAEVRNGSSLST